jgi:hypothetical protein
MENGNGANRTRTRRPWPCDLHSPFQLNLHTTLFATIRRLFSDADTAVITWFTAGILLSPTETDTVSMSKNVTASYFCFLYLAMIHRSGENVQVDIKRDLWQGRRKHQKIGGGGGHRLPRALLDIEKGT